MVAKARTPEAFQPMPATPRYKNASDTTTPASVGQKPRGLAKRYAMGCVNRLTLATVHKRSYGLALRGQHAAAATSTATVHSRAAA